MIKMNNKFKEGNKVSLQFNGKKYTGEVYVIDNMQKGYRYDIMCTEQKRVLIKHIDEDDLMHKLPIVKLLFLFSEILIYHAGNLKIPS